MYSVTGDLVTQTYIEGSRAPSESVAPNYGVRTCGAYCVKSGSNGSVIVYYRWFARIYGTVNSTLQSALCSGTWGTTMAGTYLSGATGETWYYGTSCGENQYDYSITLTRDGSNFSQTNAIGWYGGSGTAYQSTGTMFYGAPHSVNYNANNGSGAPSTQTKYYNKALTLSTTKPTRTGYTFKGWGTSSTATTVAYAAGASYTANAKLNLYAIWTINTYKITYNANGGSGAPSAQTKTYGKTLTLSSTKPTKTGYTFLGWSTSSSATSATYAAGGSYTANSAATLYAVWKLNTYTVSYNANGGSGAPSSQTKTYGVTLTLSSTKPTRTGYTFKGWGTSSSATTVSYAAGASYTANAAITLYAIWSINSYTLDVNGRLDGTNVNNISGYGTFDIKTTQGTTSTSKTSITDYCTALPYGTKYEITNIIATTGHTYNGVTEGSLSGTIGTSLVYVRLSFSTDTYSVTYNSNTTDTVSNMPSSQTKTYGADLTLSTLVPSRDGYTFLGWSTSSSSEKIAYSPGATYSGNTALALYAVWRKDTLPVFIYTSSTECKAATKIWVYNETGEPKQAVSVTVYDSNGSPHTFKC
jgi:uncharacterized repeat protein (TIGR02543 family)